MESDYYEPSPIQTLAEAQLTQARLSGVVRALYVRAIVLSAVIVLLATLTGTALFGVITSKLQLAAVPYGILPSLTLLGAFLTYKVFDTYLDLIATRQSLLALQDIYSRAIWDAKNAMGHEGWL